MTYRFAMVAVLAGLGCGDGRTLESDGSVEVDASNRGIVRVRVTGFVQKAGLQVYFQENDSTLSLATQTDADGVVTGLLGPNGFVTLVAGFEPTLTLWTYTGVQPGDEVEFFEPDVFDTETPIDSISVFAPDAGAPPFTLRSSCGVTYPIFDALPVALPIAICEPEADFLFEFGQIYRYAKNVDLSQRRIDFDGPWVDYAASTVTVTGVPPSTGIVTQSLMGHGSPLEFTTGITPAINGDLRVVLGLPLPPDATMLTEIEFEDSSAQRIIDWRPSSPTLDLAYGEVTVAPSTQSPRYDASTTSIVWNEGAGTPGNLVRASLHWLDGEHSRTRSWVIIGPRSRGSEPVLRVPLLPVRDLVPTVEIPQTMESFLVGDLDWVRKHLHGRWLSQGVKWPTEGDAGRVVWRSL